MIQNEYRYILASNKVTKLNCPYCQSKKHWQRYIDTETDEVLPEDYGRCDNVSKCHAWNNPYKDGYAKMIREQEQGRYTGNCKSYQPNHCQKPVIKPKPVFIPVEVFKQTLQPKRYEQNVFLQNLLTRVTFPFEPKDVEKVVSLYYLGTINKGYRAGAVTFPFIDIKGNVRAIQVKQFDKTNHTTGTDFLHSMIEKYHTPNGGSWNGNSRSNKPLPEWLEAYNKNETKVSCLFGEHLLSKYPLNPVALVEAPKTAVYSTLYFGFPERPKSLIWLAVYNKSSFTFAKLKALQGRDVYTFPDLSKDGNTFAEWQAKAKEIESRLPGTRFVFSDLLEQLAPATDREKGNDLADYLIQQDWDSPRWQWFREQTLQEQSEEKLQSKAVQINLSGQAKVLTNVKVQKPLDSIPFEDSNCEKCEKCEAGKKTYFSHTDSKPINEKLTNANIQDLAKFSVGDLTKPDLQERNNFTKPHIQNLIKAKRHPLKCWSKDISALENYFAGISLPKQPIKLNQCSTIANVSLFVDSHLATIKANSNNATFLPYLNRLKAVKEVLTIK